MFRGNELAIPVDVLVLVLYKLDLKHLFIFMRLNKACQTAVKRNEIWQKNYASHLPLNDIRNRVVPNWFELFRNHYQYPDKKLICNFLKLYPAYNDVSGVGQVRLAKVEANVLACIDFEDWFCLICLLRNENRLNLGGEEDRTIRSIILAVTQYMIDTIFRTHDWQSKTNAVVEEISAITAIERLDRDPNREDQLARHAKKSLLYQQLAILKKNSRNEAPGLADIFTQHFQGVVRVDFAAFTRMSKKGELQLAVLGNRFRGA